MSNEIIAATEDYNNGYICTVDLNTAEGKVAVAKAINGADALSEHVDEELTLIDVVTADGVRSKTGEKCINTYLILADGTALFSQSDGVARSIDLLVRLWNGNFGDGIKVKCVEKSLNNGNTMKTVVPM